VFDLVAVLAIYIVILFCNIVPLLDYVPLFLCLLWAGLLALFVSSALYIIVLINKSFVVQKKKIPS
jgi:hypothetical protein